MRSSMQSTTIWLTSLLLLAPFSAATPARRCPGKWEDYGHKQAIADNYLNMWNGDFSLQQATLAPDTHLYQDRVTTEDGSVPLNPISAEEVVQFMTMARGLGWEKYEFVPLATAIGDKEVVIRWRVDGIMGEGFGKPTTLKPGDPVTYNGTDFLYLEDKCDGLIRQIDSAQDYVTLFHGLGLTDVKV